MGITINDEQIIADPTKLAKRMGVTRAGASKHTLLAPPDSTDGEAPSLFPRGRVTSKAWMIGTPPKSVRQ